jgi:hypothetical protein
MSRSEGSGDDVATIGVLPGAGHDAATALVKQCDRERFLNEDLMPGGLAIAIGIDPSATLHPFVAVVDADMAFPDPSFCTMADSHLEKISRFLWQDEPETF